MFRVLLLAIIAAIAIDYFVFEGRYFTAAEYYVQKTGRDINAEVVHLLDRGR